MRTETGGSQCTYESHRIYLSFALTDIAWEFTQTPVSTFPVQNGEKTSERWRFILSMKKYRESDSSYRVTGYVVNP